MNPLSTSIDKAAIGLSMICAVHCLLLPVVIVMLPTLAATTFGDEQFHQWMLLAVLPTSLVALTMGCQQHRSMSVLAIGVVGLTILTLAVLFGHAWLGEVWEKAASLTGASLIALSHLRNHTLCKRQQCDCESK
ncbi:Uncharacterised protein [Halioglobus japonicus]|nr:Uncharacterised protein [Halioglobus japonicus]